MGRPNWERYLSFRCTGCGNCCRETFILVSDEDLRRIEDGTGRRAAEFVRFVGHDDIAMDKSHPYWVKFDSGRKVMTLRWRRGSACTFLGPDNRCGVYDHRPTVCRQHPFNVTRGETGAIERISLSRLVKCPHDWDGHTTRRELAAIDRDLDREGWAYMDKIEAWNERRDERRTPLGFLRYLGFDT
jgi:Fe-S-cluster containining protein